MNLHFFSWKLLLLEIMSYSITFSLQIKYISEKYVLISVQNTVQVYKCVDFFPKPLLQPTGDCKLPETTKLQFCRIDKNVQIQVGKTNRTASQQVQSAKTVVQLHTLYPPYSGVAHNSGSQALLRQFFYTFRLNML